MGNAGFQSSAVGLRVYNPKALTLFGLRAKEPGPMTLGPTILNPTTPNPTVNPKPYSPKPKAQSPKALGLTASTYRTRPTVG